MSAQQQPERRRGEDRRKRDDRRQEQIPVAADRRERDRRQELTRRTEDQLRIDMCETFVSTSRLKD